MAVQDVQSAEAPVLEKALTDRSAPSGISPSWVNRLIAAIERLPIPPWVRYAIATGIMIMGANAQVWVSGTVEPGRFEIPYTYYGILAIAPIWLIHYTDRVAKSSLATFRAALDVDGATLAGFQRQLTLIPARPAAVLTIAGYALAIGGLVADPEGRRDPALPCGI